MEGAVGSLYLLRVALAFARPMNDSAAKPQFADFGQRVNKATLHVVVTQTLTWQCKTEGVWLLEMSV